jgi:hypothetical protein
VKITPWGVKIDLQGLIVVAAITAVAFVINTMAIPIAPSLWMRYGGVVSRLISVCFGPLWYTLTLILPVIYRNLIIGGFTPFVSVVIIGVWGSVLDKYFPPLLAVFPHLPILSVSYFENLILLGYPQVLALQVLLKGILNTAITTLLFTLVIAIPHIYKILPLRYDSWVARYWLLKMDE